MSSKSKTTKSLHKIKGIDGMENFDYGIIGGGPAGYTAALHTAANGHSVILFEKDEIGGACLNRGCIPTKTILHSSEIFAQISKSEDLGIVANNVNIDFPKVMEHKNKVVEKLRKGIELALKNAKVTVVKAEAKLLSNTEIAANDTVYTCDKIICATGAIPRVLKGLEFDGEFLISSDDILSLENLPKSILIVGSGAIGLEWAGIMSNFGVETTVLEAAPHLLPIADLEVSKRIERIFKTKKINFFTNTTIQKIENKQVTLSNEKVLSPEKILVAVGRVPNSTEKLDGVKYIGDVSGQIQLAHFAIKEALEEVSNITFRKDLTPSVIYGTPEVAWVGKREQDLEAGTYKKSMFLISALGKANCDNATDGFIKLLVQENKIVGAHIVSKEASSLLQQVLIAIQNNISVDKMKEICFAHPTYSEGIFESLFRIN